MVHVFERDLLDTKNSMILKIMKGGGLMDSIQNIIKKLGYEESDNLIIYQR